MTEQYVCQELQNFTETLETNYYWSSSATAEVDFLISDGLDVYPLEAKAGVSKTQIVNIENGSNLPTLPTLCKLAAALKVNPHDMLIFETEKDQVDEQAKE